MTPTLGRDNQTRSQESTKSGQIFVQIFARPVENLDVFTFSPRSVRVAVTAAIVAAVLAPATPASAQSATCNGQQQTSGVTVSVESSSGVTEITGTSGVDVIVGTPGRDIIRGLAGSDIICGLGGNDVIYAGKGADRILGGSGRDVVLGGNGNDRIWGGTGDDRVFGGNGNDRVSGGTGSDVINGEADADRLSGGRGNDRINGGAGNDIINGNNGHDTINGNNGHDTINGNTGSDELNGGAHDDLIDGGADADVIAGNDGTDTCVNREAIDSVQTCENDQGGLSSLGVECTQASLSAHYTSEIGTQSPNFVDAERRLLEMINETREVCDLEPLSYHAGAEVQAQAHSQDMIDDKNSGHPNGQSFAQLSAQGSSEMWWWFEHSTRWRTLIGTPDVSTAGENIAAASPTLDPTVIHRNLINSGGHLCNILSPRYDGIGLGFTYFDTSSNRGQIVTEIFTGDRNFETTSGSLIVLNALGNSGSGTLNCWG